MAKEKVKKQYLNGYERILKIDYMISHMHYPSVEDFARETEASIPTINRDLRDLRLKFGAEDILQYDRIEKGFYYTQPSFRIPAMLTSEKQIIAARLMANLLKLIKNTPIYKQAIEVFTSLSDNIEDDSKLNAKKLSNRILFLGMDPVKIDDDIWAKLEEAMSQNNYIRFKYLNYEREFVVQPWQLIYSEGMWSLYAYNQMPDIKDVRFYNLPGIHDLEIDKKNTFELPDDFEYTKRAKGNFRRYIGPKMLSCKLKITSEKTLNYIKTYNWAEDQKFEKQDDGCTIMTFTTNQDYPVLGWVMSHGMYVQPLEPEWLVDEWTKNVRAMARLATGEISDTEIKGFQTKELDKNLYHPMSGKTKSEYKNSDGDELRKGRIDMIRSSAAMIYNLLGNDVVVFSKNKYLPEGLYKKEFEKKYKSINVINKKTNEPYAANLDAWLHNDSCEIFIESKCMEWLQNNSEKELAKSYIRYTSKYFYPDTAEMFRTVGNEIPSSQYDSCQMFRHTLAIYNYLRDNPEKENKKIYLVNVVWELGETELLEEIRDLYKLQLELEHREFQLFYKKMTPIINLIKSNLAKDFDILYLPVKELYSILKYSDEKQK